MRSTPALALPSAPSGWFDYRYFLLSAGELAILRTDRDLVAEYDAWQKTAQSEACNAPMPDIRTAKALLSTFNEAGEGSSIEIPLVRHPVVDRLPDGRWILASARAEKDEQNGLILFPDGKISRSLFWVMQ